MRVHFQRVRRDNANCGEHKVCFFHTGAEALPAPMLLFQKQTNVDWMVRTQLRVAL